MKNIYKIVFIVFGLIANTLIGFQGCPNLISQDDNILVILGIMMFVGFVCPAYIFLINLIIKIVNNHENK